MLLLLHQYLLLLLLIHQARWMLCHPLQYLQPLRQRILCRLRLLHKQQNFQARVGRYLLY